MRKIKTTTNKSKTLTQLKQPQVKERYTQHY